jgi:hypothetical protein
MSETLLNVKVDETCSFCNQNLSDSVGCVFTHVEFGGRRMPRIRCWESLCPGCGAEFEHFHHPGCKFEVCPSCHCVECTCRVNAFVREPETII